MTRFQMAPFDGSDWNFQPSGSSSGSGAGFVVDAGRLVVGSPWRPGVVDAGPVPASLSSSVDCRDELMTVGDVDELETTDNEHIDVDTVDDSSPPSATAATQCLDTPLLGTTPRRATEHRDLILVLLLVFKLRLFVGAL